VASGDHDDDDGSDSEEEEEGEEEEDQEEAAIALHRDGGFDEYGTLNYLSRDGEELLLPHKLFLFCNREDPQRCCENFLLDMRSLHAAIPPAERELLRDTPFWFEAEDDEDERAATYAMRRRFEPEGHPPTAGGVLYFGAGAAPRIALQPPDEAQIDRAKVPPAAAAAYESVCSLAARIGFSVHLQAGDLLILRNNDALHGRSALRPLHNGGDRWLQRMSSSLPSQVSEAARGTQNANDRAIDQGQMIYLEQSEIRRSFTPVSIGLFLCLRTE